MEIDLLLLTYIIGIEQNPKHKWIQIKEEKSNKQNPSSIQSEGATITNKDTKSFYRSAGIFTLRTVP
jgi:hypothetical protein